MLLPLVRRRRATTATRRMSSSRSSGRERRGGEDVPVEGVVRVHQRGVAGERAQHVETLGAALRVVATDARRPAAADAAIACMTSSDHWSGGSGVMRGPFGVGHWIGSSPAIVVRCMSRADDGVVRARPVQHAAVVPDDEVADRPLVAVDPIGRGGPASRSASNARPSSTSMPSTCEAVAPSTSERRPDRCRQTRGCVFAGRCRHIASSSGDGSGFTSRCAASKRVHDAELQVAAAARRRRGRRTPRRCWRTRSRHRTRRPRAR